MIDNPEEKEEKIHNVQVVIDQLAAEVLGVDLSHIEAQCIVEGSEVHVQNLLEIFDGLLDLVMEDLDEDEDEDERNEKHQQQESMFFLLSDCYFYYTVHYYQYKLKLSKSKTKKKTS